MEHLRHHRQAGYFSPTSKKIATALPIVLGLGAVSLWFAGPVPDLGFTGAFLASYATYEVLHRRLHTVAPRGPVGRYLHRHRLAHHHSSPRYNHGVTSPLWDLVFRTYRTPARIRVPQSKAEAWMIDGSGTLHAEYPDAYELITRRPQPDHRHRAGARPAR